MKGIFPKILFPVIAFLFCSITFAQGSGFALSQSDLHSIYNDSVWYKVGGVDVGGTLCDPDGSGSNIGVEGTIESLMQAIAIHESGGNPRAQNDPSNLSSASGKYQMIQDTWQNLVNKYYPPAQQYSIAAQAPEEVQDAVVYLTFADYSIKQYNAFQIAIIWYGGTGVLNNLVANFNVVPSGNTETFGDFGNEMVDWVQAGRATDTKYRTYGNKPLSSIPIKPQSAPEFGAYLAKLSGSPRPLRVVNYGSNGQPISSSEPGVAGSTVGAGSCSCADAIVAMAKAYAWPTYRGVGFIELNAAYRNAIYQSDIYGGGPPPGVDCGAYVTRVIVDSGADPGYNYGGKISAGAGNTGKQKEYLDAQVAAGKYVNLGSVTDTSQLQPGDIAITANTHTYLYLGDQGFQDYDATSASQSERAPMASNAYFIDSNGVPFTWYRINCQ